LSCLRPARFDGVYFLVEGDGERLATRNLTPGVSILGEKLVKWEGQEYRLWSPYRSKLSAAILNGLKRLPITEGSTVLYLGAASGTTASYVSDIVGERGTVFCVEFGPRPMKELLRVCELRSNMVPILADARRPDGYAHLVTEVDSAYQDVAQPNQAEIFCLNVRAYLRQAGSGILMVKSRSVDVARKPEDIFREEMDRLTQSGILIEETVLLHPFDKDHIAIVGSI